jgi:hypothetical protein
MKPLLNVVREFIAGADPMHRPKVHADDPMSGSEREQVASDIERFLDGTCGPYDWDDLTSESAKTTERQAVLNYLISTSDLYPANSGWCSDVGEERLRAFVILLRSDAKSVAIREFIGKEYSENG